MKRSNGAKFSLIGFFLFSLTIGITSTASIFVYYLTSKAFNGNVFLISLFVLLTIAFGAGLCSVIDVFRRKSMIDEPVNKILDATEKIASGDFGVKLEHLHEFSRYDQYDLIFDNINTMTAELSKNELLKNDFISNVSHEIKTPLAVIQNYAKALQNTKLDKNKKTEYLNGLILQSKKLADLIGNILKLNKLENQQIIPEVEEFDLSELVRMCVIGFENLYEKKDIEIDCDIEDMCVTNSSTLIELILNNLISNAIKFTECGGKISVSLKSLGVFAEIKVKDTGCGISKEVGEHIFDKFYQGDTSRYAEGNGLGLSLVKKVIDLIGGEIAVESNVGVGSTFTVKIKKGY